MARETGEAPRLVPPESAARTSDSDWCAVLVLVDASDEVDLVGVGIAAQGLGELRERQAWDAG